MSPKTLVSIFLGLFGVIFISVGVLLFWFRVGTNQEIEQLKQLPLLTAAEIANSAPGTEAVIEGRVAERNQLYTQGFAAYIRSQYQGERCTDSNNNNDNQTCTSIWNDDEKITPALWLDLANDRTQLANQDYQFQTPPEIWLSTGTLIKNETLRYQGFKINSPVFAKGSIISTISGPAFSAEFLFGGNRQAWFDAWHGTANTLLWMGIIFVTVGLVALIAVVCIFIFWR